MQQGLLEGGPRRVAMRPAALCALGKCGWQLHYEHHEDTQTAGLFRAQSLALGPALHGGRTRSRQAPAAVHHAACALGVWPGFTREHRHCRSNLADDLPDDAEDRFRRNQECVRAPEGLGHHAVRQLADQAVQHGAAGVDICEDDFLGLARSLRRANSEQLHCRVDHPRGGAVHGDGFRLELSH